MRTRPHTVRHPVTIGGHFMVEVLPFEGFGNLWESRNEEHMQVQRSWSLNSEPHPLTLTSQERGLPPSCEHRGRGVLKPFFLPATFTTHPMLVTAPRGGVTYDGLWFDSAHKHDDADQSLKLTRVLTSHTHKMRGQFNRHNRDMRGFGVCPSPKASVHVSTEAIGSVSVAGNAKRGPDMTTSVEQPLSGIRRVGNHTRKVSYSPPPTAIEGKH